MSYDPRKKSLSKVPLTEPKPKVMALPEKTGTPNGNQPSMTQGNASAAVAQGRVSVKNYGGDEMLEQEQALAKRIQDAEEDLRAMKAWVAKMILAEAQRELFTVIAELAALGVEEEVKLPERPELWSWRHWLSARKTALQVRIQQG
jgi:hypothetical protein